MTWTENYLTALQRGIGAHPEIRRYPGVSRRRRRRLEPAGCDAFDLKAKRRQKPPFPSGSR